MKYLYSYNKFSEGAKLLAETMGIKRIRHNGSRYRYKRGNEIINWGSSSLPDVLWPEGQIVSVWNDPEFVKLCANKLKFFQAMEYGDNGPRLPEWTDDHMVAQSWSDAGCLVVARTVLNGHSAEGLVLIEPNTSPEDFTAAPLYTKYVKKKHEFRVHIVAGNVIDVQRKAKKQDFDDAERDTRIRNLANGYIYAREGFVAPDDVLEQAKRAMACSGLDFGAVDVIFNEHLGQAFVLEINTAPGLTGTTLTKYAEALGAL